LTKERSPGGMSPLPAAGAAADTAAKESNLSLSRFARTQDATSVGEQAIPPATEAAPDQLQPSTQCDLGIGAVAEVKPASVDPAAVSHATAGGNGELFAIAGLESLAAEEREIVRQSDVAFVRIRQTWQGWKEVRAGLVVLRELAMRETGSNSPMSKLYKDSFHELLEQRAYCSTKMDPSVRKALLKRAELAPEIDEWHDRLDERRRLRLNNPIAVLHCFRKSQEPSAPPKPPQHEVELAKVREEAAAAVSSRDERINDLQQQIDNLSKRVHVPDAAADGDTNTVVQYVITACSGSGNQS
jgi:hypothetical protein